MSMLVRKCPKCSKLFWKKEEEVEYADENTLKVVCNHCQQVLRIPLITKGPMLALQKWDINIISRFSLSSSTLYRSLAPTRTSYDFSLLR